jgi:hypothetical protein|tara:strand:- start:51 stop:182 length:132 start_codon:yes stop_codon:yes gene_type:complete
MESTGNAQVNNTRTSFNEKVSKLKFLGSALRNTWNDRRRNRSI